MASGGDTGASLKLTIVGGLEKCAGQSEMPAYVAPNQTFEWHANYDGVSANSSQGGGSGRYSDRDPWRRGREF